MTEAPQIEQHESTSFEGYFRDADFAPAQPLAWALSQRQALLEALRGLFNGPQAMVQLRLWCFMELAAQPQARLSREDVNRLFHAVLPDALDTVLKRLRDINLLVWDATPQDYHLSPLAQQVHGLLAPMTTPPAAEYDDMAALLSQVAGAQQLGLVSTNQLKHLHAQLARLHDEFSDAIASGSESRLRVAQPRFDRALELVDRAGQALTALIRAEHEDPRLEREARAIGQEQARLLSMASQFTRALQQADRQRVTLGSTGLTTSDVRAWLQRHPALWEIMGEALSVPVRPVMVSQHDLIDVAEGEFERDRPVAQGLAGLPPPAEAASGTLDTLSLPPELGNLISLLDRWSEMATEEAAQRVAAEAAGEALSPDAPAPGTRPLSDAILGGRFAQAAYRMQLMPLVGDAQAQTLKGLTGDLARAPWQWQFKPNHVGTTDEAVSLVSDGFVQPIQFDAQGQPIALPVDDREPIVLSPRPAPEAKPKGRPPGRAKGGKAPGTPESGPAGASDPSSSAPSSEPAAPDASSAPQDSNEAQA
ncbi:MAG: hypothetical protein HY836_02010 [Aquabacterium sp.]|uniref:hypothetical protein n=1 Tax=Aquabacterium sp. TaxID=1872578 RepID=UPI0025BB470E|nr:hypothetical protein [Aquabacterium sp.]MBI5924350.1 hypothetical protein [Aquabacterium sp.]